MNGSKSAEIVMNIRSSLHSPHSTISRRRGRRFYFPLWISNFYAHGCNNQNIVNFTDG